jgi:hypothetical protein
VPTTPTQDSQRFITFINFILVSGMLACFAFVTNKFIGILYDGWDTVGLPVLTFLIAFESLLVLYIRSRVLRQRGNPFLAIAAEWILILVVSKVFLLLQPGGEGLWQTVRSSQGNLFQGFFDMTYVLLIFFLFVIWGLTRIFSPPLYQLEEDQELMEQEKLGVTFNDRQEARRSLMGLVFFLGFVMVGMTVLLKGNVQFVPFVKTPTRAFITVLMIYFALAFIFLALNQYAILKARWYFNDIQVNPDLGKRWLLFSLVFILIVVLLTVFLPTDFAFGFLPVAQALFTVALYIFGLIQFLFLFPISFIVSLFNSLLGTQESDQPIQPALPEFNPDPAQAAGPLPWWDLVKSILFWAILLGLVIFAIRYYINSHQGLKAFFDRIRIKAWLTEFWQWFKRGFKKMGQVTAQTVQRGIRQVQKFFADREVRLPSLKDLIKHLPPRQALILTYLDWVRWNKTHGIPRQGSQTPLEYAGTLSQKWPGLEPYLTPFTADFIAARYTRQAITPAQLEEAQTLLAQMKSLILAQQDQAAPKTA